MLSYTYFHRFSQLVQGPCNDRNCGDNKKCIEKSMGGYKCSVLGNYIRLRRLSSRI